MDRQNELVTVRFRLPLAAQTRKESETLRLAFSVCGAERCDAKEKARLLVQPRFRGRGSYVTARWSERQGFESFLENP